MVLLSFLVREISVHRNGIVLCDGFVAAMGLAVMCQSGGGTGQRSKMGAVRIQVIVTTEYVCAVETAASNAVATLQLQS